MGEVLMKHMDSDQKYVIAWFKIAEYVNRGEKERALGVYRLLSHSIDDPSLVLQLEADILYACQDERCFDIYYKAALDYLKKEKKGQAAALFEQMLLVKPDAMAIRSQLVTLYIKLEKIDTAYPHMLFLVNFYMKNQSLLLAYEYCSHSIKAFSLEQQWEIYRLFLVPVTIDDPLINQLQESIVYILCDIAIQKEGLLLEQLIVRVSKNLPHLVRSLNKYLAIVND